MHDEHVFSVKRDQLILLLIFPQIQVATMLGESIVLRSLEQFVDILSNFAEEIKGRID